MAADSTRRRIGERPFSRNVERRQHGDGRDFGCRSNPDRSCHNEPSERPDSNPEALEAQIVGLAARLRGPELPERDAATGRFIRPRGGSSLSRGAQQERNVALYLTGVTFGHSLRELAPRFGLQSKPGASRAYSAGKALVDAMRSVSNPNEPGSAIRNEPKW